jgi:plasmid replication initiation protein
VGGIGNDAGIESDIDGEFSVTETETELAEDDGPSGVAVAIVVPTSRDASILKKAVEAIFMKSLNGSITHVMHRAYNVMLKRAAEQGQSVETYRLPIQNFCKDINFDSRNTDHLKETLRRLNATQVEWNAVAQPEGGKQGKKTGTWGVSSMLAGAEISNGYIEYSFAPQIKSRLLNPDVYARFDYRLGNKFSSRHSMVLYEACVRFKDNPSKKTTKAHWTWWRDIIVGENAANGVYGEWKYFFRSVLKRATDEINRLADDITIELLVYREGRRVTDIQFVVNQKIQQILQLESGNVFEIDESLAKRIEALGVPKDEARSLNIYFDEEAIIGGLVMTEERQKNKKLGKLTSPSAYFKRALEGGYAPKMSRKELNRLTLPSPESEAKEEDKNWFDDIKPIKDYFNALDDVEKQMLAEEFSATLSNKIEIAEFKRKGLSSAIIAGKFYPWLKGRNA